MPRQVFAKATPELLAAVEYLRDRWAGPASRPSISEVTRAAILRCAEAEKKSEKKSRPAT